MTSPFTLAKAPTITGGGGGDMEAAVYDPTAIAGDAFDADNHVVDAIANLTATDVQAALSEHQGDIDSILSTISVLLSYTDIDTLAELNAILTDATLIDTGDSRLSDARTPTAHATSHESGGGDVIKLDNLGIPDDNTDLDATGSLHGLMSKVDKTKLDNIENNATADQSGTELATNIDIENLTNRTSFESGDKLIIWEAGVGNRKIDYDDLPSGGGGPSDLGSYTAAESMTAPCLVHFNGSGEIQYANATDNTQPARGFILSNVTAASSQTVYGPGQKITGLSGLTPGAELYLDTTDGQIIEDVSGLIDGNIQQYIGYALSATIAVFDPGPPWELAS